MATESIFALPDQHRRKHAIAPWWVGYLLLMPPRQWLQNPRRILAPHVAPGQTVLEVGTGMGFFTLPLAELVGERGRVVGIDCQERMLDTLRRRADRGELGERIETRGCRAGSLEVGDLAGRVDFVLAFNVVHEARDPERMVGEMARCLRPGGRLLLSEPRGHVSRDLFLWEYGLCREAGLRAADWPRHRRQMSVVMQKPAADAPGDRSAPGDWPSSSRR
jgi:SAM-dependent methyltransferase